MKTPRILVPMDFSKVADYGLQLATNMVKRKDGEIYLINYSQSPAPQSWSVTAEIGSTNTEANIFNRQLIQKYTEKLETYRNFLQKEGVKVKTAVIDNSFSDGIKDTVASHEIDIIIMGTSADHNALEEWTGNHVEKVIERSAVPVIAVTENPENLNLQSIVLGIEEDFNQDQHLAMTAIANFSKWMDCTVQIANVYRPDGNNHEEAAQQLKDFVQKHPLHRFTLNLVADNNAISGLEKLAEDTNAGMICTITSATSGLLRIFTQSFSESLLTHTKRPLFTINEHKLKTDHVKEESMSYSHTS